MLELIPISHDMKIEGKEYNRRFKEDYIHASTFENALQSTQTIIQKEHFDNKIEKLIYDKLKRKITQFESRGVILQYDLEPFNNEDWTQIHLGMGRIPDRYDPLADKVEETQLIETLKNIKLGNKLTSDKMPPLNKYMTGLIKYLRDQNEKI
jgi:tryptophan halogenase